MDFSECLSVKKLSFKELFFFFVRSFVLSKGFIRSQIYSKIICKLKNSKQQTQRAVNRHPLTLSESNKIRQGKKSTVCLTTYKGIKAVVKTYNAAGNSLVKKEREVMFYRHYSDSGVIPELLDSAGDNSITVSFLEGEQLRRGTVVPDIEHKMASAHRRLLSSQKPCSSLISFMKGLEYTDYAIKTVVSVAEIGRRGRAYHWLLHESDMIIGVLERWKYLPPVIYKHDWSIGNMILQGDEVCFIDFEQAYIGNCLLYYGAVLDCSMYCNTERLIHKLNDMTSLADIPLNDVLILAKYNNMIRLQTKINKQGLNRALLDRMQKKFKWLDSLSNKTSRVYHR